MEQERYEEKTQRTFDSKGESIPDDVKIETSPSHAAVHSQERDEEKYLISYMAPSTTKKAIQPPRSKNKLTVRAVQLFPKEYHNEDSEDESDELCDTITGHEEEKLSDAMAEVGKVEIPDKYKPLAEIFDRIDTSIRLLSLHKKLSTFQNICTMVKVLTQRTFSHKHLAQIKYLIPEAIQIDKLLTHDEKTLCMIPDMKITLLLDVMEAHPNQSASMALRQIFHERLVGFINSHSESSEVPEAVLPEPFNQRDQTVIQRPLSVTSSIEAHTAAVQCESLLNSSIEQSTRKHFSGKTIVHETEKTQLLASPLSEIRIDETDSNISIPLQQEGGLVSKSASILSPPPLIFTSRCSSSFVSESPPVKLASLPHSLPATPVQPVQARKSLELSSCEKVNTETRMLSHTATKRSLTFDESKEYIDNYLQAAVAKDVLADDNITTARSAFTQVVEENTNHMMNLSGTVKRQQMLASLADFTNTIQHIFKSAGSLLVTKQELMQKIIAENLNIIDIRQAEEQLELLEEVVPDWIARKLVPSGDLLYSIRKESDLDLVRARLSEAV